MSDYPFLLAKLRKYFPKLIVKSFAPDNANADISRANLEVGYYNLLDGLVVVLTQNDFPLSQSIKKGFGVNGFAKPQRRHT